MVKRYDTNSFITKKWSGGTTTELFIYPPSSTLKNLDFDFRISAATIEVESSVFTPLPDVNRTFLLLEGTTNLNHEGQHNSELNPFNIDKFKGEWKTTSLGKCTPFNLMTRNQCSGEIKPYSLKQNEPLSLNSDYDFTLIYVYKGSVQLDSEKDKHFMEKSLFVIHQPTVDKININPLENTTLVVTQINLNT